MNTYVQTGHTVKRILKKHGHNKKDLRGADLATCQQLQN